MNQVCALVAVMADVVCILDGKSESLLQVYCRSPGSFGLLSVDAPFVLGQTRNLLVVVVRERCCFECLVVEQERCC